jgi:hypothetical protein
MDKSNFKKMALMGMAGGILLASQTPVHAETAQTQPSLMASGCSSYNGCSSSSKGGNTAENTPQGQRNLQPQGNGQNPYQPTPQPKSSNHGCGGSQSQQQPQQGEWRAVNDQRSSQ